MGVNYDVHDFPTSQFGLKLGGFMLLEEEAGAQANASGSDDEEMKIPPKEVVEEVAEELGLHLVWRTTTSTSAPIAMAQRPMKI